MSKFSFSKQKNQQVEQQIENTVVTDPYNEHNKFVTEKQINDIFKKLDIDYKISDLSLFQRAFIHTSYCKPVIEKQLEKYKNMILAENPGYMDLQEKSYERLEFLGDSVVGLVTVSYLFSRFFDQSEHIMTTLKHRLVNTSALCSFAEYLNLGQFLIWSKPLYDKHKGKPPSNILEDIFEAFMGALFEDINNRDDIDITGYDICQEFLVTIFEEEVDFENLILNDNNYKNQLQHYYQYNFQTTPIYKDMKVEQQGHKKLYTVAVINAQGDIFATGSDQDKKQAEQNAAKNALQKYKVYSLTY